MYNNKNNLNNNKNLIKIHKITHKKYLNNKKKKKGISLNCLLLYLLH